MFIKSKISVLWAAIFMLLLLCDSPVSAEPTSLNRSSNGSLNANEQYSKKLYTELLRVRRDLYNNPEPSGHEKRTSAVVAKYLTDLGLEVKTNIGGYGVVGILESAQPGKRIIWRADMDAAKFQYSENDHDSDNDTINKDVAHVCGHDVHTTIGLGIANTLSQNVDDLAGTVYFLFQPAEESQQGAKAMIDDGLFDIIHADEIYAAHVAPMPTGIITTSPNNVYAHSRFLEVEFNGNDDVENISAMINNAMSSIVRMKSPEKFTNLLNVTDPELGLANPDTIYQDYVIFAGPAHEKKVNNRVVFSTELFTSDYKDIELVVEELEQKIRASKFSGRFDSISISHEREGVYNSQELVQEANQFFKDVYGENALQNNFGKIPFASEDFGHFQKTVPGVYFFIGVASAEEGHVAFPHMPGFDVDEMVIQYGVSRFSSLIEARLMR